MPDTTRRRAVLRYLLMGGAAFALGTLAAAIIYLPKAGWSTNGVTTGEHPGYPDIVPHRYDLSVRDTTVFAAEALRRIPGGKVKKTDIVQGIVEGEASVLGTPFVDDVSLAISPDGRYAQVKIRSHSRVGRGDLGVNASRIRVIQSLMDEKLPRVP